MIASLDAAVEGRAIPFKRRIKQMPVILANFSRMLNRLESSEHKLLEGLLLLSSKTFHQAASTAPGIGEGGVDCSAEEQEEEARHFHDCVVAFQDYELDIMGEIARRERHLARISADEEQRLAPKVLSTRLKKMKMQKR